MQNPLAPTPTAGHTCGISNARASRTPRFTSWSPTTLAQSPERRGEVRRRKRRRRRSEQRRLSDARKILEERNAGLGPKHRDRLTLKRAAEEVGLTMSNPVQILSRHVHRRIAEQILADQTASVNDLKTILYLVHAQDVVLIDALRGSIRDEASIARGSDVYNLPGGVNGVAVEIASLSPDKRMLSEATRREDFRARGKASEAEERNQRCDRVFSEHSREIDYQTGSRWFARRRPQQGLLCRAREGPRQGSLKSELIEQVSSTLFEKDEVVDILPPSAHALPRATLTEDDATA